MPILLIDLVNQKPFKIKIIPLNERINLSILTRMPKVPNWRSTYFNHVVVEPKLSINEWGNYVDVAIMDRIYKSIEYYLKYIVQESEKIRQFNYRIDVLYDELDNLIEYEQYSKDEGIENRIDEIERSVSKLCKRRDILTQNVNDIKEERKSLECSKDFLE